MKVNSDVSILVEPIIKDKIRKFFNKTWLNKKRNPKIYHLGLSENLIKLKKEYKDKFNMGMSNAQIVEFLIFNELEKMQFHEKYDGEHKFVHLMHKKAPFDYENRRVRK